MEGRKGKRKERKKGGRVEGKEEGNFDEEAKFTKRKATRIPSKPLAPYSAVLT